jgi:hypothetical protein
MARFKVTVPDHPSEYQLLVDVLKEGAKVSCPGLGWSVREEEQALKIYRPFVLRQRGVYVQEFGHVYAAVNWIFACLPGCEIEVEKK